MTSRFGSRMASPEFEARDRQSIHDKLSAAAKFRLRLLLLAHSILWLFAFLRLSDGLLDGLFDIDLSFIERMELPIPQAFEYLWFLSVIGLTVAWLATSMPNAERRIRNARFAYFSIFVTAVLPVLWGMGTGTPPLWRYIRGTPLSSRAFGGSDGDVDPEFDNKIDERDVWNGYPVIVLYWAFYVVAGQVHLATMYFIDHLMRIWAAQEARAEATAAALAAETEFLNPSSTTHHNGGLVSEKGSKED